MAETAYRRLTGARLRRRGFLTAFATRSSLWLADDHLLCVDSTGYAEEYKRFYFRDIQSLTIRKTDGLRVRAIVFGFLTVVCIVLALVINDVAATVTMGLIGVPCLLALVLHLALGPMSVCHLRTAVQVEELPSLCRLRRARKVLQRLRPLIAAAQGTLTSEEIERQLANPPDAPPVIGPSPAPRSTPPIRSYEGRSHLILFCLLLADLPMTLVNVAVKSGWLEGASLLLLAVTFGFGIAALVQQRNTDLNSAVKCIPVLTLICGGLFFLASVVYGIFTVVQNPEAPTDNLSSLDNPVVLTMTIVSTALSVLLGAFGLIHLRRYRAARRAAAPLAAIVPPVA